MSELLPSDVNVDFVMDWPAYGIAMAHAPKINSRTQGHLQLEQKKVQFCSVGAYIGVAPILEIYGSTTQWRHISTTHIAT